MKKKWLVGLSVTIFFLLNGPTAIADEGKREIQSIEEPTWIFKAGISKGKYHDRQDLGFILRENTIIKIRQTNPSFKNQLTFRLLSNDSKEEKSIKVGTEWVSISATTPTVPFFDTPYDANGATIEYQIDDKRAQKPLPIFEEKSNQATFFETWDKYDGNFALIKSKSFQLLIPKLDKEKVRKLKDFQSVDELIVFYEDIFSKYNQYIGLDDSAPENKVNKNRYFLKADASGAGGAYYGTNWTANTSKNTEMWLNKNSWGALHEIAHGYQAGFDGKGMYTGEISNNLFGVQYQYDTYGKNADNMTWLFNYGKRVEVDNTLYRQAITEGKGYGEINDHRSRLVLLTMLKQKAGKEAFAKMYQEYRKLAAQPNFKATDYLLPDLINKYYSETSSFDFSPALEKLKLEVDQNQAELQRLRGYLPVAALVNVVPKEQLEVARKVIDQSILINSNFELVDNQTLAPLGLKGALTIKLDIDDLAVVSGKKIQLKDGHKIVKEATIKNNTIQFTDVPNGVYSLEIPNEPKDGYTVSQHYAYVKEQENELTVQMKKINAPAILNETVNFLGLGDNLFAEFKTNLDEKNATFTLNKESVHSYYAGEKYASIKVLDQAGTTIYSKEIEGTNNVTGTDTIPFEIGYQVVLFHDEVKNRLIGPASLINKNTKENNLVMTKFGLKNNGLNNDPEKIFVEKINQSATEIIASEVIKNADYSNRKSQLLAAIKYLEEPLKTEYLEKYGDLFKETEQLKASTYTISLTGHGKKAFSELSMDIPNSTFSIATTGGRLYPIDISNIGASDAMSISIKEHSGKVKYYKEYLLKKYYYAEKETATLNQGDIIVIKTARFVKVDLLNINTEKLTKYYTDVAFKVTGTGLEKIDLNEVPK